MPSCIIRSCPYRTGIKTLHPDIILHVFPKDIHRIKVWLERTGHVFKNIDAFADRVFETKKNDNYRLCSAHFTDDCYVHAGRTKVLKVDAIPSIFPQGDNLIEETFRQRASRKTRMNRILNSLNASKLCVAGNPNVNLLSTIKNPTTIKIDVGTQTEIFRSTCHQGVQVPEFAEVETRRVQRDSAYDSTKHLMQKPAMSQEGGICLRSREFSTGFVPDSLRKEKDKRHMTEGILNLTLEIIYLLTGEDYKTPRMMPGDCVTHMYSPHVTGGLSRTQSPIMEPPPHSLIHERNNDQRILELTNKIIQLLTGEVPIRCQDVTVYFSMEEWEYLEGHKDLYKSIMIDNRPPLTPLDLSKCAATDCPSTNIKEELLPCEEGNLPLTDIHTQHTSTYLKEESMLCKERNITCTDIYTFTDHTQHESTPIKAEPMSCEERNFPHTDIYTSAGQIQHTSYIKEEPVSCEEGNLAHSDTSAHTDSCDAQNGTMDEVDCSVQTNVNSSTASMVEMSTSASCQKWFISNSGFPNNRVMHTLNQFFVCSECGMAFTVKSQFVIHQRTHTGEKPFDCSQCGKCFGSNSNLVKHQRTHTGEKPYCCSECGKCFTKKSHLTRHQRTHTGEKPYFCSECGKCFISKSELVKHQRTHTGEKPFSCSVCGKSFTRNTHLVIHERIHTGEKPYSCSECGKCFISISDRIKHEKIHTGEKPYCCAECGKCFTSNSYLVIHQRTHTGEKPYSCAECGKCFISNSYLVIHQRSHTGEKPYYCSQCGKCFISKPELADHQAIHTGEEPYSLKLKFY
ncbi:uncharacterized protein LOC142160029 [Mixophyes fleayi]|uniref:uncharacterized protein LOC142160029 n=1 Tax=Mixophyes fleayi TaxID=3061075 RepID=UPI003F4E1CB3